MAMSDFQKFWFLIPKNQNFVFFKDKYLQNQFFGRYPKNGIHSIKLYTKYWCRKFQANTYISGRVMAQKTGKGDDVIFLITFFGISNCRSQINDIFGILRQNWTRYVCFEKKFLNFEI